MRKTQAIFLRIHRCRLLLERGIKMFERIAFMLMMLNLFLPKTRENG